MIIALVSGCKNPFSEDEIQGNNQTIYGKIVLENSETHNKAYVWLEGLNLGTFPDEDGNFSLMLPTQSVLGNISGVYDLYFYSGNYGIVKRPVSLKNGEFVFGDDTINGSGSLHSTVYLAQKLECKTFVQPTTVKLQETEKLSILTAVYSRESIQRVTVPNGTESFLGAIYIIDKKTGKVTLFKALSGPDGLYSDNVPLIGREWILIVGINDIPQKFESFGSYEVIPHIVPNLSGVPAKLFETMGVDPYEIGISYLTFPMVHHPGSFLLTDPAAVGY